MNDAPSRKGKATLSGHSLEALFGRRGWLSEASTDLRARLLFEARPIEFARGERVYAIGDPAGGVYGVVSGGIGIEASARGHPVRMGHIVRPGFWFGEGTVLGLTERLIGAVAVEDSLVIHLQYSVLKTLTKQDSELWILLGKLSQVNNRMAIWVSCDLLIPEAPRRIAAVLLRIAGLLDGVAPTYPEAFLLNQTLIGELANVSRPHVNRVLSQLTRMGLIVKHYNKLQIVDPQGLARFAYSED
jgi:CRP-like cAMP-binding protein